MISVNEILNNPRLIAWQFEQIKTKQFYKTERARIRLLFTLAIIEDILRVK